jgi:hypothetical protein
MAGIRIETTGKLETHLRTLPLYPASGLNVFTNTLVRQQTRDQKKHRLVRHRLGCIDVQIDTGSVDLNSGGIPGKQTATFKLSLIIRVLKKNGTGV